MTWISRLQHCFKSKELFYRFDRQSQVLVSLQLIESVWTLFLWWQAMFHSQVSCLAHHYGAGAVVAAAWPYVVEGSCAAVGARLREVLHATVGMAG